MSLFKLKNLWVESFPQQQFDQHHLCLGNIDGMPAMALGSFQGYLRIFTINQNTNLQVSLIYQTKFQSPIISVQFVAHPQQRNRNTIGVLIFRKFFYISLRKNTQLNNYQAKNLQINVQPAFTIQKNSLSIFTINSSIQYLNPLSIQPLKVSDPIYPFVRKNNVIYYADGQQLVMTKNAVQQWRIVVGPMRDLYLFNDLIIVIGDNALWQVEQSQITKTKVLEQDISCGTIIHKDNDYNIIVANFSNKIFIYKSNYTLIWAMKANQVPVKICIFQHKMLFGALALLGQQGTLSISYVGSEIPQTQIQHINQQIDMQKVQIQTQKMLAQLKNKQNDNQFKKHQQQNLKSKSNDVKLLIKAKNPKKTQKIVQNDVNFYRQDGELWCCEVECSIIVDKITIYDIMVTVQLPSNITCLNNNVKISSINGSQNFNLALLCSCQKFPYTNHIQISISYENNEKKTSVISEICQLPISFQSSFKSLQLEQKPTNKIVFKANSDLPAFSQIFYEFDKILGNSKTLTLQLPNGVLCSMGYNKNNTKVKIQTNFFSGLCFIFIVFKSRFQKLVKSNKIPYNQITIDDIPLQQFFVLIKDHFTLRTSIKQKNLQLQRKCEQFRNTQKKLIIKMKEKVSSINNIDKLLEFTYQRLISAADVYQNTLQQIQKVNHNLQIAVKFIIELLFMKTKATQKCKQKVLGIIGYQKQSSQFGWEQKILANSGHYLNKKFNYSIDKYSFDQLYKTVLWVISKINSGQWNE